MIEKNITCGWVVLFLIAVSGALGGDAVGVKWVALVTGMSCPLCAKNIEKQVSRLEGVVDVKIDLGTGRVEVVYSRAHEGDKSSIAKAIKDAGFEAIDVKKSP